MRCRGGGGRAASGRQLFLFFYCTHQFKKFDSIDQFDSISSSSRSSSPVPPECPTVVYKYGLPTILEVE